MSINQVGLKTPMPKLRSWKRPRLVRTAAPGFVRNPLKDLPRNMACPCKSGRKWKVCCLPVTHPYVREEALPAYQEVLNQALAGDWAW